MLGGTWKIQFFGLVHLGLMSASRCVVPDQRVSRGTCLTEQIPCCTGVAFSAIFPVG